MDKLIFSDDFITYYIIVLLCFLYIFFEFLKIRVNDPENKQLYNKIFLMMFYFLLIYPACLALLQYIQKENSIYFFYSKGFKTIPSLIGWIVSGISFSILFMWSWFSNDIDRLHEIGLYQMKNGSNPKFFIRILASYYYFEFIYNLF